MLALYTTEQIVSEVFTDEENKYKAWYDIITKLRPTMKILLAQDTDYDDNENNPVYQFQNNFDIDVDLQYSDDVGENSDLAKIRAMQLNSISDPCAIVILDVDVATAKKISEHYGIICHSFQELPEKSPIFQDGIEKNLNKGENKRGWHELIFPDVSNLSNSLIFIDRYLFRPDTQGEVKIKIEDGIENVRVLLDTILPKTEPEFLKKSKNSNNGYHILFIFDATLYKDKDLGELGIYNEEIKEKPKKLFKVVSEKINKIKKKLNRPYTIDIEIVSINSNDFNYDETHNRRILSNYFFIRAEHSLKAFRGDVSLYTQSLWLDWVASKGIVHAHRSDVPGKSLYRLIKEIRKTINQLKKSKGLVFVSKNGKPIEGIPNNDIKISNRLIQNYE